MKLVTQTDTPDTFRNWLSVVDILKKDFPTTKKNTTAVTAGKYKGDLYGLFASMGIPSEYFVPIMMVNGIKSSISYNGDITSFVIPDENVLSVYRMAFTT